MEDERNIAKGDNVLKSLVSRFEFEGGVYSSEDELDLPYESNEVSDDIDEMVCREQIKGAKDFFNDLTVESSDEGDEDDDYDGNIFNKMIALDRFKEKAEGDISLRPKVKYSDALSYFEAAMERNSKMRDMLLTLKQTLLKKKQEYEDMIYVLEEGDELIAGTLPDKDSVETGSVVTCFSINNGVVVTNKTVIFAVQFLPPYFKTMKKFHCPPNKDTLNREKQFPISLSSMKPSKYWSPQSIENLENTIKKALIQEFKNRPDFKAIYKWREYSAFVKSHSLEEVLKAKPPDYKLDWMKIATLLPSDDPRSPSECSKLWEFYLCPKYSKAEWTDEEDLKIVDLVKKYDEQSWDKVAEEVGTGRSPFQLFSYYQSNLRKIYVLGLKWTHEEDEYIKDVISGCTYGDFISWKKVLYYCEKRTYTQIYNRWQNTLAGERKGKFSEKEDRALMTAMAHGVSFKDMSKLLRGKRTAQQIRERIMGIVKFGRDEALNVGDWSTAEDKSLINLVTLHGEKWPVVAKELGTRDRTQCRHRYHHLKKYMLADPNFDIKTFNRRFKRKGYTETLRSKKQYLLKLLSGSPLSQNKKKTFLLNMKQIIETPQEVTPGESVPPSGPYFKYKGYSKFFYNSGSGYWSSYDHTKSSPQEMQYISDFCTLLEANLNYDLYDDNLENDEHLRSVKEVIPSFKEDKMCEASSSTLKTDDGASTSVKSNCKNILMLPPNPTSCFGFLQSLVFCSNNERIGQKTVVVDMTETEEVKKAKELFQKRLYQFFIWPALFFADEKKKLPTHSFSKERPSSQSEDLEDQY